MSQRADFGQLETQQDADERQQASDQIHDPPTVLEPRSGDCKRQTHWQWGRRRREPQTEPDAENCTKCRKQEDQRRIARAVLPRGHLVDVGVDDGEIGADADSGDGARDDKPRVIVDHRCEH